MPARHALAMLPTPLIQAPRLSDAIGGPRILIKRDDMTGFGFGGNKVRGLEYYLAEALEQGCDIIVTGSGPQSNHLRATAAAARVAGMEVVLVMHGSSPATNQGNLLLDRLLEAQIHFTDSPDRESVEAKIDEMVHQLRQSGRRPYIIPRGGASALGALGYIDCALELNRQLADMDLEPDWLVLATGSCGTQSGLLAGAKIHGASYRVLGITVSRSVPECRERIGRLALETAELAGHPLEITSEDIIVRDGLIGPGYGVPTPEGIEAIRLVAGTEGLFFDPTYTGKGMAGLMEEIRSKRITKDETVVFLHTGGEPGLFASPEIGGAPA